MSKCYLYTNDGYYAGEAEALRRLPANATFTPPPPGPWVKKWPRLVDGTWILEEDHRERPAAIFGDNAQEATEYWLAGDSWDSSPARMTCPGPLPEGALLEKPAPPLAEVKAQALEKVDAATSAAILAGFDYEFDGVALHFSYDSFDQQNFADSANVATRVLSGEPGLPVNVTWNAYAADGSLKRLELGPADFLDLYTRGALGHKAACMEKGGQLKEAINAASGVQAVEDLLATLEA